MNNGRPFPVDRDMICDNHIFAIHTNSPIIFQTGVIGQYRPNHVVFCSETGSEIRKVVRMKPFKHNYIPAAAVLFLLFSIQGCAMHVYSGHGHGDRQITYKTVHTSSTVTHYIVPGDRHDDHLKKASATVRYDKNHRNSKATRASREKSNSRIKLTRGRSAESTRERSADQSNRDKKRGRNDSHRKSDTASQKITVRTSAGDRVRREGNSGRDRSSDTVSDNRCDQPTKDDRAGKEGRAGNSGETDRSRDNRHRNSRTDDDRTIARLIPSRRLSH